MCFFVMGEFSVFGDKKGVVMGSCAVMDGFWLVEEDRNRRVVDDIRGMKVDNL